MVACISVCVYYVHAWCPRRPEEGVRSPGTGVTGGCEPPCGCWQPHSPLQELQVLWADELLSLSWLTSQPNLKLSHKVKMDKNLMTCTTETYVPFLSVYMCGLGVRCMCLQRPTSDIFLYSSHLCSETGSLADLELAVSARLGASKPSESASVPPNLSSARYSYVLLCLALMCMLGIQIQIASLHSTL